MSALPVVFFVPDEPELDRFRRMDPDTDWSLLRYQRRWTVQTYLRLAAAGHPVTLSGEVPDRVITRSIRASG